MKEPNEEAIQLIRSVLCTCLFPRPNDIRCMAASYALDLGMHDNLSMSEMARKLGISRAALSGEATKIIKINGLKPSRWMKMKPQEQEANNTPQ